MDTKTLPIAEFESKILATLSSAGSQSASKFSGLAMSSKTVNGLLNHDLAESMAWRVYMAVSLGLVSEDFLTHFRQALTEIKRESLDLIFQLHPPSLINLEDQESHRIFRGYVSLDEEYIYGNHEILHDVFLDLNAENVEDKIKFCKDYPEETTSLLMVASDVFSFLGTIESSPKLEEIIMRRFANIIDAYTTIHNFNSPTQLILGTNFVYRYEIETEDLQTRFDDNNLSM